MEIGLGVLRYTSAEFWALTLPEFKAALDGYLESHGSKRVDAQAYQPPTPADRKRMGRLLVLAERKRAHASND